MGVNLFMVLTQIFATIDTAIPFTSNALHTDVTQRGRVVKRLQIFFVDTYSVQQLGSWLCSYQWVRRDSEFHLV
jgi:hypothetical protein